MTTANKSEFTLSVMLVAGLLAAVSLIYLFIYSVAEDGYGKNLQRVQQQDDASLIARIRPVVTLDDILGDVSTEVTETEVAVKSPQELFDGACTACHTSGVAGAPKLGSAEDWSPRAEKGVDALLASAQAGKGAMPPNGGTTYTKEEIRSIIEMMLTKAGLLEATPVAEAAPVAAIQSMPEVVDEPVKAVSIGETPQHDLAAGAAVYKTVCFACHDSGAAGAPKLGDSVAWGPRIATGFEALLHSALNGKGAMPAKGGAAHLTDTEIANIVAFMMDKGQ